jgi:hypothetical protein
MQLPGSKTETATLKVLGWASVAIGVAALGIICGRELRQRYKFKKKTPYDYYSHAGDASTAEYGVGI